MTSSSITAASASLEGIARGVTTGASAIDSSTCCGAVVGSGDFFFLRRITAPPPLSTRASVIFLTGFAPSLSRKRIASASFTEAIALFSSTPRALALSTNSFRSSPSSSASL